MARGVRTPRCPAVSDECVETAATLRPTSMSLLPSSLCQVLLEPASSVPVAADSMGRSRFEEPLIYRVAGGAASGGSLWRMGVGARRGCTVCWP